jgi:RNA polymerase sigma factor (TIGR02999 family)
VDAESNAHQITQMLQKWSAGDRLAGENLTPIIYNELRKLAESCARRERVGHTLQPTALIHEAYLRLLGERQPEWNSRNHFFRFAARLMRHILVDYARSRAATKRGGNFAHITLTDLNAPDPERSVDLLALDEALERLGVFDDRAARVLELRYFGGLTEAETAESLAISAPTVRRDLRLAEAWLSKELGSRKS